MMDTLEAEERVILDPNKLSEEAFFMLSVSRAASTPGSVM